MGALNVQKVNRLGPGRHNDGDGLYLLVSTNGARSWVLRTYVHGRRRDIGLGPTWRVKLSEAREEARKLRAIARSGGDPLTERRRTNAVLTFAEAAETVWAAKKPTWKNEKHAAQWIQSLREYAFPRIGDLRLPAIHSAHVLEVLTPIWTEKPETARRVRQRIEEIFQWAKAARHFEGENPVDGVKQALPKQSSRQKHHSALPWRELPKLMGEIASREAVSAQALQFLILTATRSGETRGAQWRELDLDGRVWSIPGERMKSGRPHRVPLTDPVIEVLDSVRGLSGELVFPAPRGGVMSDMVFKSLFKRLIASGGLLAAHPNITAHGFRSSFRDWCSEEDGASWEVAEAALAHSVGDATERAYARSDLFERRRALMEQWANFAIGWRQ